MRGGQRTPFSGQFSPSTVGSRDGAPVIRACMSALLSCTVSQARLFGLRVLCHRISKFSKPSSQPKWHKPHFEDREGDAQEGSRCCPQCSELVSEGSIPALISLDVMKYCE